MSGLNRRDATRLAVGLLAAPTLLAGACSRPTAQIHRRPTILDRVTYLTGVGSTGREAAPWVAQAKGFFANHGVDVTILPGAAGDSNLKLLAGGKAQFGVIDYSGAVVRAGAGAFDEFRCVAALTQQTLIAIMTLAGSHIISPRDLAGKTIGQATGAVPRTLFAPYAKLADFDPTTVTWREVAPDQLLRLLAAGKVDAIGQFTPGVPAVQAAAGGRQVTVFPFSDYLGDLYGNVLVTTNTLIAGNPDLVRRVRAAVLEGLAYAVAHPAEAGDILHAAVATTPAKTAEQELILLKSYVGIAADGSVPGTFDPARVARGVAVMQSIGIVPSAVPGDQIVAFTLPATPTVPSSTRS
jgi:NitT/TauT family transport system substrate-binding protein